MSQFDNPFADPTETSNPFDDPSVQSARSGASGGNDEFNPFDRQAANAKKPDPPQQPAVLPSRGGMNPPPYTASAQQRVTSDELDRKQRELEAKARELEQREAEQRRREQESNAPGRNNNWPPLPSFCPVGPCFYQDFEVEIPAEFRSLVRIGYYLWIAHAVVLLINIIGTASYFIVSPSSHTYVSGPVFGFSFIVCIVFVPCSFVCWFRPFYKAFKNDSSFNYFLFFVIFFIQFVVLTVQCLGIDYLGSCGWINGFSTLKSSTFVGTFMLIIAGAFTVLAVVDMMLLIRVHTIYRSSGASFAKAKQEFSQGVLTNETVRSAAGDAASASARSAFSGGAGRY